MRMQQCKTFCGRDLQRGCQMISIMTAVSCVLMLLLCAFGLVAGGAFLREAQKLHPGVRAYGGSAAFERILVVVGAVNAVHLFFCFLLYSGVRLEGAGRGGVAWWVRGAAARLFAHAFGLPYALLLLLLSGGHALALVLAALLALALALPVEVYLTLVVNNYRRRIAPETTICRLPKHKLVLLPISPPLHF